MKHEECRFLILRDARKSALLRMRSQVRSGIDARIKPAHDDDNPPPNYDV
jgi:hypothetical protein